MSNLWWHNIPQCKVGDLVRCRTGKAISKRVLLVIEVNPEVPCKVNPEQHSLCINNNGREKWFKSKSLEVMQRVGGDE